MIKGTKLQLKLLSNSGELLNVVNCFPGKITVLRGYTPAQLEPYKNAVCGIPGRERIVVTLDGQEFMPIDHELIGFGGSTAGRQEKVQDFLLTAGLPDAALDSVLLSFGLKEQRSQSLAALTPCQERRVRLLAATYQAKKVVILNNPFEPLASEWRERFAELLLAYVEADNVPLLITDLDYRPDCWINNQLINRVQVGENSQRTIGFGSAPSEFEDLIRKVRDNHKTDRSNERPETRSNSGSSQVFPEMSEPPVKSSGVTKQKSSQQKRPKQKQYGVASLLAHPIIRSLGALAVVLVIAALYLEMQNNQTVLTDQLAKITNRPDKESMRPEQQAAKDDPELPNKNLSPTEPANAILPIELTKAKPFVPPNQAPVVQPSLAAVKSADERAIERAPKQIEQKPNSGRAIFVLDQYGPDLKNSIISTYQGDDSARSAYLQFASLNKVRTSNSKASSRSKRRSDVNFTQDLLRALQSTDGSGAKLPDSPVRSVPSSGSTSATSNETIRALESKNYQDLTRDERRTLLREKFREAIERASQNRNE